MNHVKRMKKAAVYCLTAIITAGILLTGCSRNGQSSADETVTAEKAEDQYDIYYKNAAGDNLTKLAFRATGETFDAILAELMDELLKSPSTEMNSVFAADRQVFLNQVSRGVDSVSVDISSGYLGMTNVDQVLLRAALVKTLTQLPGLTGVYLTVEGQDVTNASGDPIGLMDSGSFIESGTAGINSIVTEDMTLYFAGSSNSQLIAEKRKISYSSNLLVEQIAAQALIDGPQEDGLAVVTSDTAILGVRLEDTTCILDMNSHFSDAIAGVDPETALSAFVNTICANSSCDSVRFMIDGSSEIRFRDAVSLDQTFLPVEEAE